jgi:hypothetical protein
LLHKIKPFLALEKNANHILVKVEKSIPAVVCHAKMHLCANFGCVIMKGSMYVIIPWLSGLKAKISHT